MSTSATTLTSIAGARAYLRDLEAKATDSKRLATEIKDGLKTEFTNRFDASIDPDGDSWAGWAARTIDERRRGKHSLAFHTREGALYQSGDLFSSLYAKSGKTFAEVGYSDYKASWHQFGVIDEGDAETGPFVYLSPRPLAFMPDGKLGSRNSELLDKIVEAFLKPL